MPGNWPSATVAELQGSRVLLVEDGNHGESRPRPDEFADEGDAFIRAADMDNGRVFFESASKINKIARQRIRKGIGAPGDILLSHKGTVGKVALVPASAPHYVCSPQTTFWRTLDEGRLDRRYLYAFMRSPEFRAQLATRSGETDMAPYVSLTSQRGLSVPLPPPAEQRAIGHILGTLDDKIEVIRKMAATLQAMAQALFKSWFVDFDPVHAKAEGRDPGLSPHLAFLFPDRLVETEEGEIPEGWALEPLGHHIKATKGVSYQGEGLVSDGVPLHNLNSIYEGGGYKYEGIKYYVGDYKPHHIVRPGDVIVANTEQGHNRLLIGYAAIIPRLFGASGIASHHIYILARKPSSPFQPAFLCAMLNSRRMHDTVSGYANGTTVNMLPEDGLRLPPVVIPPSPLIQAFDTLARDSEYRREEIVAESLTLAGLRDALLPKLVSGEIRVNDAERFLADRGL